MNHNEPAFPVSEHVVAEAYTGLTKREYFAGMAMQGLVSYNGSNGPNGGQETIANRALSIADALIAELNKPIV